MTPAAHLAIEEVRRLPAGAGQGAACTATLEDQTLSLPVQHAAEQTLLVRVLGWRGPTKKQVIKEIVVRPDESSAGVDPPPF